MLLVFEKLCNRKFPEEFGITSNFQEFVFDVSSLSCEEMHHEEMNEKEEYGENEEVFTYSKEIDDSTSYSLNSQNDLQKLKDTLTQNIEVINQIEIRHQREIAQLKLDLETITRQNIELETRYKILEQEKNDLLNANQDMKLSVKRFFSSLS